MSASDGSITELLNAWRGGDAAAHPRLADALYAELRRMALRRLAGSGGGLDPTELVHEAFLRLCQGDDWQNRAHFYALAALHMRNVLVDDARERLAAKRGGGAV